LLNLEYNLTYPNTINCPIQPCNLMLQMQYEPKLSHKIWRKLKFQL
jgi:hypothetical protein